MTTMQSSPHKAGYSLPATNLPSADSDGDFYRYSNTFYSHICLLIKFVLRFTSLPSTINGLKISRVENVS